MDWNIPQNKYEPIRRLPPLEACSGILGGKYTCHILWMLVRSGSLHYGELRRLAPCATARTLARQLKELENDGLIARSVVSEKPLRVAYSLTAEWDSTGSCCHDEAGHGFAAQEKRFNRITAGIENTLVMCREAF